MFRVGYARSKQNRVLGAGMVAGLIAGSLALTPLPAHAGAPFYGPAVPYGVGAQPRSVATIDADGDGVLDVVSADFGSGTVSVLPGLGDGTLGPSTPMAIGAAPTTVLVGDFNHDNDPDLAVTTFATAPDLPAVSVLLGAAGLSFGAPTAYPLGQNALGGAVADVDLDGNQDVIAIDAFGVSVLAGAADGTFGAATRHPVGTFLAGVAVGDFNHDGDPDLALGQFVGQVLVLLGASGASFGAPVGVTAGLTPDAPAVGDVNGDGHLDLAVSDFSAPNVSVLLGAGDGSFAPASVYSTGVVDGMSTHALVARLDGDTHPDIVVTNSFTHNVSVLLNAGDGTFGAATSYGVGTSPFASAAADLDGDGGGDLVVADAGAASVSVLLSQIPNQPPDCGAVAPDTNRLWPPNHKLRPVRLGGAQDPDGDELTMTITGITHDERVERFFGLGITPDAQLTTTPGQVLLRAERDGTGDGRVYRIAFTVTDPHAASCSGVVTVGVPHSFRG